MLNATQYEVQPVYVRTVFASGKVRASLDQALHRNGIVTVGQLYEFTKNTFVSDDEQWGWRSLDEFEVKETDKGYQIVLPEPRRL